MKKAYTAPALLAANGGISLTVSQAANLGIGDVAAWIDFWNENSEIIEEFFPGFAYNDDSTWDEAEKAGFDVSDQDTWYILIGM